MRNTNTKMVLTTESGYRKVTCSLLLQQQISLYHYRCCTLPHSIQCQATNSKLHLCTYIFLSPTYAMLCFHCTPAMARGWENCTTWQQRCRFCFKIKPSVNHVTELLSNIKTWILQCNSTELHLPELSSTYCFMYVRILNIIVHILSIHIFKLRVKITVDTYV